MRCLVICLREKLAAYSIKNIIRIRRTFLIYDRKPRWTGSLVWYGRFCVLSPRRIASLIELATSSGISASAAPSFGS